jgi:ABC-type phosphate/phosphonate transport system substrate-binding protein
MTGASGRWARLPAHATRTLLRMADLRLLTYLGANANGPARSIADRLTAALGRSIVPWAAPNDAARRAALADDATTLCWMCGLATVEVIDAGLPLDIVAAPVFPGRPGPTYGSVIVASRSRGARVLADLAGSRLAVNERGSWSGYHALRAHLAAAGGREPFFGSLVETGSQAGSAAAVLAGEADTASIDDTIWEHLLATVPQIDELVVVERTRRWPAPPFSVPRGGDPEIRAAIVELLPSIRPDGLERIEAATNGEYDAIRQGMRLAAEVGP